MINLKYFIIYIFFNILTTISLEGFCDKTKLCSDCTICGKDDNNFCSCNLENIFCKNKDNGYTFLSDFLLGYDECQIKKTEFNNICGISDINLEIEKNISIHISSRNDTYILCHYNIKIDNNNNNKYLYININNTNESIFEFSSYSVYYYLNNENKNIFKLQNIGGKTNFYYIINETNISRISLYILIKEAENIDNISIDSHLETNTNYITKIRSQKSNSNNIFKILFIIIISATVVFLITLIILLIRRYACKNQIKLNSGLNINNSINKNDKEISISDIKKRNKEIIRNLYKNELSPKIFYDKNFIKEIDKCTICQENFREGTSFIVTTKCCHYFHFNCLKNFIHKNIISPKCPNCNEPILKDENIFNKNYLNATNPSSIYASNSQITNSTHITLNNSNAPIERCEKNAS